MRPPALFPLFAPVSSLKGVGPRVTPLLERVAGPLVRDLLFLAPHALVRRRAETDGGRGAGGRGPDLPPDHHLA